MAMYLQLYLNDTSEYIVNSYKPIKEINVKNFMYERVDINMNKIAMAWMLDSKNNFVWHNDTIHQQRRIVR